MSVATGIPHQFFVVGGNHQHLGNMVFYQSTPAVITDYQAIPEHSAVLSISHNMPGLISYHELYQADDISGTGARLLRTLEAEVTEIQVEDEGDNAFYALKSIPLHGQKSNYSSWTHIEFIDVVDPDANGSYFTYENFFTATIHWSPTGYESYYKGFRIVEDLDTTLVNVSPLLDATTQSYTISTTPGRKGSFYVLAVSQNDQYNEEQPNEQKIEMDVPTLNTPSNFRGRKLPDNSIRILWEPLATDNTWYSGYLIEKKVVTDTSTIEWEDLIRFDEMISGTYIDEATDSGNTYSYKISSYAFPPIPESAFYSDADSISISTK